MTIRIPQELGRHIPTKGHAYVIGHGVINNVKYSEEGKIFTVTSGPVKIPEIAGFTDETLMEKDEIALVMYNHPNSKERVLGIFKEI